MEDEKSFLESINDSMFFKLIDEKKKETLDLLKDNPNEIKDSSGNTTPRNNLNPQMTPISKKNNNTCNTNRGKSRQNSYPAKNLEKIQAQAQSSVSKAFINQKRKRKSKSKDEATQNIEPYMFFGNFSPQDNQEMNVNQGAQENKFLIELDTGESEIGQNENAESNFEKNSKDKDSGKKGEEVMKDELNKLNKDSLKIDENDSRHEGG